MLSRGVSKQRLGPLAWRIQGAARYRCLVILRHDENDELAAGGFGRSGTRAAVIDRRTHHRGQRN